MDASSSFFDHNSSGEIRKIIDDNAAETHKTVAHLIPDNVTAVMTPVLMFVLMFAIDYRLGILLILTTVIGVLQYRKMSGGTEFLSGYSAALQKMSAATVEYVRGMQIIKIFGVTVQYYKTLINSIKEYKQYVYQYKLRDISESFQNAIELNQEIKSYGLKEKVEAQIDQQLDESENLQWKAQITQTIPVTIGQTLSILPIGITATVGLSMLASGQVSILILLGYIIMAAKLSGAMGGVLLYLTEIFYLDARIARIGEIKNHELQGGEKAVLSDFNVEIKDVCFSYQKDTQVIRHASFTAEQGQVTALVGPSGCGKTTMLKLISRLYDADSGTVQIGGTDIREIHTDSLFKYVSIVFQEVILFNTSIMENIRLGRLDASDEEVIRAAKLAGCNEFVSRLPDTYQTIIGENGAKLSGGERQRLSIARAILKDAPIIILDEIAASLDVETEVQIQTGLNHLIQGKTVIVISHRLKSIENADKIVVMKAGTVEACGKHAHLLKQSPTYRKMIEKSNLAEKFNY